MSQAVKEEPIRSVEETFGYRREVEQSSDTTALQAFSRVERGFLQAVLEGLRSHPKTLPCKYLYDAAGSRLFEEICELEEYYLAQTELQILEQPIELPIPSRPCGRKIVYFSGQKSHDIATALRHGSPR